MNKKVLFFDIDGTLIDNHTKKTPPSAIEALRRAREGGHLVFLNTGRVLDMSEDTRKNFAVDGMVLGCGTQIIIGDETIYERRIEHSRGIQLKNDAKKYRIDALLEAQQGVYFPPRPFTYPHITGEMYTLMKRYFHVMDYDAEDGAYDFDKFCIVSERDMKKDDLDTFFATCTDFEIIDRGQNFYECVPLGCSKGDGIKQVLLYLGLTLEDAYVFGDSSNDMSMFTCGAKHRIVMGEYDDVLKPYATFETKKVTEDGIFYAMEKLGLI